MAKKKNTAKIAVSQEEGAQAQQILSQYHELATTLRVSSNQEQAVVALAEVSAMPEGSQIALLKGLAKEKHVDAADILTAVYELSPLKAVRKEARRSLIQLEASRIYPQWQPPVNRAPALGIAVIDTTSMRFWRGIVTDSLDMGEVQLLLCWEQGNEYKDVRVMGFLLEYSFEGVKDFFSQVESKRSFERFLARMMEGTPDVEFRDCSLAEGRRLLGDALAVNQQRGTNPHRDYRMNLSLVNELILNAPDLPEDDESSEDEENVDLRSLTPSTVVTGFIERWANEDYDIAYEYLAQESPLRAGLTKDEWVALRQDWAREAHPGNLEPVFAFEREQQKPRLWLPRLASSTNNSSNTKEFETSWSIEADKTLPVNSLPELPEATIVYEETGQRWFWATYTLTREDGVWHIQSMIDENVNAQKLSIEELQKKIEDIDKKLETVVQKAGMIGAEQDDEEVSERFEETVVSVGRSLCYDEVLIKKLPLDPTHYESAYIRAFMLNQYERCLSYLLSLVQRFPEHRAERYRRMAHLYRMLVQKEADEDDEEREIRYQELGIEALHESLALQNSFEAHISLAELLIEGEDSQQLDEAEAHLLQAKALATNSQEEAHVELHLGEVAIERDQPEEALKHYQRVIDLQPDSAESWLDLGNAHDALSHFEEAEESFKHAIKLEPDNDDYYRELSGFYAQHEQPERSIEVLKDGLSVRPNSLALHLYIASQAIDNGDYRTAKEFLDEAERLDPNSEIVPVLRQVLEFKRQNKLPQLPDGPLSFSTDKRKRNR